MPKKKQVSLGVDEIWQFLDATTDRVHRSWWTYSLHTSNPFYSPSYLTSIMMQCWSGHILLQRMFWAHMLCHSCIVSTNAWTPFHHISEWQGTHFECTSLSELGVSLCLGHRGNKCRHCLPVLGHSMVVVHTNSIHHVHVEFCPCELISQGSDAIQLIQAQLFPASMEWPETAFTFAVQQFSSPQSDLKKSVQDYVNALWKHTNPAFPQNVPVCIYVLLKLRF